MKNNIEEIRKRLEKNKRMINCHEIGRRLGYSGVYISYLINGKRKNDKLLLKIAEVIEELKPEKKGV
jgi:transcription initiation factor IIE alpha subunit